LIVAGKTTHDVDNLGTPVLDTKRSWWGICGFYGVYATRGVPRNGKAVQIAFEIKMLWQNPFCDKFYSSGTYMQTFRSLCKAMHFKHLGPVSSTQTTAITYIRGQPGWAEVGDQMNANFHDIMATFENHLAVNPALIMESANFKMGSSGSRSALLCCSGNLPPPRQVAGPVMVTIDNGAATQANIQAIQQYHHLRNSKEEAEMVQFVQNSFEDNCHSAV
jgi:hypothetical protein